MRWEKVDAHVAVAALDSCPVPFSVACSFPDATHFWEKLEPKKRHTPYGFGIGTVMITSRFLARGEFLLFSDCDSSREYCTQEEDLESPLGRFFREHQRHPSDPNELPAAASPG